MIISQITIALTTYNPMRPFPNNKYISNTNFFSEWYESILRLPRDFVGEVLIIEKADNVSGGHQLDSIYGKEDPRLRVIETSNDPPYADPFRAWMLEEAINDWVLILDDDERISPGLRRFLVSLAEHDPAPGKAWAAIRLPREDYIFHEGCWRYAPANGADHQMRFVNRHQVSWPSLPHSVPEIEGTVLTVGNDRCSILHYRDFDKIISWTQDCNDRFANMPHIVQMQNDYIDRLRKLLDG